MRKKNGMKTIYPKRIQSILRGETPKTTVPLYKRKNGKHKVGERWVDSDGVEWEQKEGYKVKITKLDEARTPLFCPRCGQYMNKRKDPTIYKQFGFCMDCLVERDNQMMIDGTFKEYEQQTIKNKRTQFLEEAKSEIKEYLENMDEEISYVNEDGTLEKWKGDMSKVREFFENELQEIDKELDKMKEEENGED